ncbi:MAG: glycosyltransferase family 2 protein [Chloroflexota bacterium]|nr:MAG: glycosyltransferase family 2 protein [Chloroflexota bacterium]
MTQLELSAVICTYTDNRWEDLAAAVESLRQQEPPPKEIIIVVDHNPALQQQADAYFEDALVIPNREPRGLSGARNSGVAAAQGTLIAFLDDDATAAPGWLARLSHWCEHPQVLGAVGAIEPVWLSGRPAWFPQEFLWVVGCTYRGLPKTVATVRNLLGGGMCIKREVFQAVGGFRTEMGRVGTIPLGCEETELCIRARQVRPDGAFVYDPQALILHRVPAWRARWRYYFSRCYAEGLSKATLSQLVGFRDGLSSERDYVMRTLPRGILEGVQVALRGDRTGLARASAIVTGLILTGAGYLTGRMRRGGSLPAMVLPRTGQVETPARFHPRDF